jgi:hypothetical protein
MMCLISTSEACAYTELGMKEVSSAAKVLAAVNDT